MTKEEIDILWNKAIRESVEDGTLYTRYRFAELVAADEREACAKVCEAEADATDAHLHMCIDALRDCADAIRARGQA